MLPTTKWNVLWRCLPTFLLMAVGTAATSFADVPLEGFIPLVGIALTDEFQSSEQDPLFFVSDGSSAVGGNLLGNNGDPFFDVAVFDTGAATHLLTWKAHGPNGFDIEGNGFGGSRVQFIGGSSGAIFQFVPNDPHGVYATGLGDRVSTDPNLVLDPATMRGQTSFSLLSPDEADFSLPMNILGLPMATAHAVHIKNSEPILFELQDRTVRTPQIELHDLGSGGQGIQRGAPLILRDELKFAQGAHYQFNFIGITEGLPLHENPATPTVVPNSAIFIDVDLEHKGRTNESPDFLLDTGATMTMISTDTAMGLGIDPIADRPDFTFAVKGSGGVEAGIPGYYVEKLSLRTEGGSFELENVPVAVLDVTNPADIGNVAHGILGMNVFSNRDLVVDAIPNLGGNGPAPALYISDPVTAECTWTNTVSDNLLEAQNWMGNIAPDVHCNVQLASRPDSDNSQKAVIESGQTANVYRATIAGTETKPLTTHVEANAELLVYADVVVGSHGGLHLGSDPAIGTASIDAQFIAIQPDATLTGSGDIAVVAGPITGSVRNDGTIAPGGTAHNQGGNAIGFLNVVGDVSQRGTMEFDLAGISTGEFDTLSVSRNIYLNGKLKLNLVDAIGGADGSPFEPNIGDRFGIIQVDGIIEGKFAELELPDLPDGYVWDIDYLPNSVEVEVMERVVDVSCDGDGDGDCDLDDLNALYASFRETGSQFDFDGNDFVSEGDIQGWLNAASAPSNPAKPNASTVFVLGDVNLDGQVDDIDLGRLLNSYRRHRGPGWGLGNLNGDGNIDSSDLGLLLNNYNFNSSSASTVPEPHSLAIVLIGFLGLLGAGRRSR